MNRKLEKSLLLATAILFLVSASVNLPDNPLKISPVEAAASFFSLSVATATIIGNPSQRHAFQPVHTDSIVEVNKPVNGNTWRYFAYDCDVEGTQIRLYYSNDTANNWTQYATPILGVKPNYYRWPSTTLVNGIFNMFVENRAGGTLERWTSTDGINYKFLENVKVGGNEYKNPFIWLNPNDGKWYLYSHDAVGEGVQESLKVRSASSLDELKTANDITITTRNLLFGSPTVTFCGGVYWLLAEVKSGTQWQTVAYYSTTSPSAGFTEASNSPILPNDESCPMLLLTTNKSKAYLYTIAVSGTWYTRTYEVYINSQQPTPSPTAPPTQTPTPTPSPTATPTPTPSPTPTPTPEPTTEPTPPSFSTAADAVSSALHTQDRSSATHAVPSNPSPTPKSSPTKAPAPPPVQAQSPSPTPSSEFLKPTAEMPDVVPIILVVMVSSVASTLLLWRNSHRLKRAKAAGKPEP